VLSPATRAMLWRPAVGPSRDFFHFGFWRTASGLATTGNIEGANAHLDMDRDSDLVVAVIVNRTGSDADEAAGAILDRLRSPGPNGPDLRAEYAAIYRQPYEPAPGLLGAWSGSILTDSTAVALVLEAGADGVRVRLGEADWTALEWPKLDRFGELRGSLRARCAGVTPADTGETRVDLALAWEGDRLLGYVLPRGSSARPLPVRMTRAP
jgi:hypothetical protein